MSDREDKYQEMRSDMALWRSLLAHPAWEKFKQIAEGQVAIRSSTVLRTPLKSMDSSLEQEFMKGEITGIETLMSIPQTQYEVLESQLKEMEDEPDEMDEGSGSAEQRESRELLEPDDDPFGE